MIETTTISTVRKEVKAHIGCRVRIKANKGRKRVIIKEGVLENTYPSIFVVKVQNEQQDSFRSMSYSYTDLLTRNVELTICGD